MEFILAFKAASEVRDTDGNQRCDEMSGVHKGCKLDANGANTEVQRRNNKERRSSSLGSRSAGSSESDKKHKRQRTRVAAEDLKDWQKLLRWLHAELKRTNRSGPRR